MNSTKITFEDLAYWYFRLNGFLTIQNFIVHPDEGSDQKTEIDIIGVRFPNRQENFTKPMEDAGWLLGYTKPLIVLCEVKDGRCSINDSWLRNGRETLAKALNCVGAIMPQEIDEVVENLRQRGISETQAYTVQLVAVGKHKKTGLVAGNQLLLKDVARFIHVRLNNYRQQKANHRQWSDVGQALWDGCVGKAFDEFWDEWNK